MRGQSRPNGLRWRVPGGTLARIPEPPWWKWYLHSPINSIFLHWSAVIELENDSFILENESFICGKMNHLSWKKWFIYLWKNESFILEKCIIHLWKNESFNLEKWFIYLWKNDLFIMEKWIIYLWKNNSFNLEKWFIYLWKMNHLIWKDNSFICGKMIHLFRKIESSVIP